MPAIPFIIKHIQLGSDYKLSYDELNRYGYYCFFWWEQIPLGHLYIKKNEKINNDILAEKILFTIKPVIDYYITKAELDDKYASLLGNNELSALLEIAKEIFKKYIPTSLPRYVDVSLVICTRNRSQYLANCLNSLLQQDCLPKEIIVVDNAPSDDITKNLVKNYPQVTYCREPQAGLDIARTTGARLAANSIIAYTDDDVMVHPHWVFQVWKSFENSEIAAMTGLVIASSLKTESQQIFENFWTFNRGYMDKIYDTAFFRNTLSEGPPVWDIGAGANMAFRKDVLEKLNFFDTRLDVGAAGCNGDSEMWYRILSNGYSIQYNPRAVCYHEHREEMAALQKQLFFYMRGFTAAALIQQDQIKEAGYRKLLFKKLPKYYVRLFLRGFLRKDSRHKTLWSELKGIYSGLRFYRKHKNQPS